MGLEFRPVSPIYGVEVLGVDLSRELSDSLARELREAWYEHKLLLFRDLRLDADAVDRAAGIFGEPVDDGYQVGPREYVSNVLPDALTPNGELKFHNDMSFWEEPLRGIALYAFEVPPEGAGGDTMFSNVKLVYDRLPQEVRNRVKDLQIVHTTAHLDEIVDPPYVATHNVAFTHPVTSETLLFCSPRHFKEIVGLSPEQSKAVCSELEGYINDPATTYTHVWRPGDFVVWDNLALQHARTNFDPTHRRHLKRVELRKKAPVPTSA